MVDNRSGPGRLLRGAAAAAGAVGAGAGALWLWRHHGELIMRRPINEWSFTHMDRLLPSVTVPRSGPVLTLPERPVDLTGLTVDAAGTEHSVAELLARTNTTSFLVLHRGEIVHESYPGRFAAPGVRFQLNSVTKSVTSLLLGIALEEGAVMDLADPVTAYVDRLRGSAYDDVTVEWLLDMCSGVGDLEDWTNPDSLINRFEKAVTGGGSLRDVVATAPRTAPAGTRFNYSTVDTQVLGWVVEGATGRTLDAYAAEKLWSRIGAEHDAYYWLTRGRPRTVIGGGSLNATTRDLARVGLLVAGGGELRGERIVPAAWVERGRGRGLAHLEVGTLGDSGYPHYGYANQWWTLGGARRAYTAVGVFGQYLYIDPEAEVVIVKTGAWPTADDPIRDAESVATMRAIADHLSSSDPRPGRP
ncbi:serine hydrolase domain-containing protein [Embleya sp. NPDC020886]|uniref:serine hydrolase domain-containing protein n=1 Tax=Embleya sp. NPDC020886 TaxID=3363980 RepID=UPI00378A5E11